MFELFLYACTMTGHGYDCAVIEGDTINPYVIEAIDNGRPGDYNELLGLSMRINPYDTIEQTKCEAEGSIILKAIDIKAIFDDADYVCIKTTAEDSMIKARIHFELNNAP